MANSRKQQHPRGGNTTGMGHFLPLQTFPAAFIILLFLMCSSATQAQFLKKLGDKVVKSAERAVERKVEQKTQEAVDQAADKATDPKTYQKGSSSEKEQSSASSGKSVGVSSSGMSGKVLASVAVSYDAPQATAKVSQPPQVRWLDPGVGKKFKPAEDSTIKQVVAMNPYLSPERPMFSEMYHLQSAPDGSLVLAGSAGLDAEGGVKGIGWWKISPDGAITSLVSRPIGSPNPGVHPSDEFSIAPDGSLLTIFTEEINTNRVGTKVVRIFPDGRMQTVAEGLEHPGMPVQDPSGNIWVSNKKFEELLRISPDGAIFTVISAERSWSNKALDPKERITLEHIAWDPVHNELVAGGGFITAKPHDLHSSVWRIRPDGQARRIYYNVKGGRSPVGQNTDAIWSLTVDAKGRIVATTIIMDDQATRQITRLDEKAAKLTVLTGQSFGKWGTPYRAGHEEAPHDGTAAYANFRKAKNICYAPDGTLFVLDEHQVRRLDTDGTVRTWAY